MLFNSNIFLYAFLPLLLLIYYFAICCFKSSIKPANTIILFFSLLFYFCTGGLSILILLSVVLLNYVCAILIFYCERLKKFILAIGIGSNIGILLYYKYAGFLYDNYLSILRYFTSEIEMNKVIEVVLPIGISFYIFQAMSYIIDVYKKDVKVQYNLAKFTLYIALFPQLVAGPIVRYSTVCTEIENRKITTNDIYEGACRFIFGLGKKVLIADILGTAVDSIWTLPINNLSVKLAWSAVFLYTLQIYFDFSGYSDMAIGIGRLLGFRFPENFILPYTATNITDFWRKWHVSLSSFLKDYLYFPLGGNRKGRVRTYINLIIVFFVCGLWHGAEWSFIVWGLYHGAFLVIERILKNKFGFRMTGICGRLITFFIVMLGWVFFRANSIEDAFRIFSVMLGSVSIAGYQYYTYCYYIYPKIIITGIIAFFTAIIPFTKVREYLNKGFIKGIFAIIILIISMAFLSDASFTPFIYFQF